MFKLYIALFSSVLAILFSAYGMAEITPIQQTPTIGESKRSVSNITEDGIFSGYYMPPVRTSQDGRIAIALSRTPVMPSATTNYTPATYFRIFLLNPEKVGSADINASPSTDAPPVYAGDGDGNLSIDTMYVIDKPAYDVSGSTVSDISEMTPDRAWQVAGEVDVRSDLLHNTENWRTAMDAVICDQKTDSNYPGDLIARGRNANSVLDKPINEFTSGEISSHTTNFRSFTEAAPQYFAQNENPQRVSTGEGYVDVYELFLITAVREGQSWAASSDCTNVTSPDGDFINNCFTDGSQSQKQFSTMRLWRTPIRIEVANPKQGTAYISDVTVYAPDQVSNSIISHSFAEPSITADGKLLAFSNAYGGFPMDKIDAIGAGGTTSYNSNPPTDFYLDASSTLLGDESTTCHYVDPTTVESDSDFFSKECPYVTLSYMYNKHDYNASESHSACDITGFTQAKPVLAMHEDIDLWDGGSVGTGMARYGLAQHNISDPSGYQYSYPDDVELRGAYPWMDFGGRNLFFTAGNSTLTDLAATPNARFNTCELGSTLPCSPSETLMNPAEESSITRGFVFTGFWSKGRTIMLDNLLNNSDYGLGAAADLQRHVSLYSTTPATVRVGTGRAELLSTQGCTIRGIIPDNITPSNYEIEVDCVGTSSPENLTTDDLPAGRVVRIDPLWSTKSTGNRNLFAVDANSVVDYDADSISGFKISASEIGGCDNAQSITSLCNTAGLNISWEKNIDYWPVGAVTLASGLGSQENLWNYRNVHHPRTPYDVVWRVNSGGISQEVAFDDYLNINALIVSSMQGLMELPTAWEGTCSGNSACEKYNVSGSLFYYDGIAAGASLASRNKSNWSSVTIDANLAKVQNAATNANVPTHGQLFTNNGSIRIEPVALGGVNGKGLWLDGSSGISYTIPSQQIDTWYMGLFVDSRFSDDTNERTLVRFHRGETIKLYGRSKVRFYNKNATMEYEYSLPTNLKIKEDAWNHIAWQFLTDTASPVYTIQTFIDGYLVDEEDITASTQANVFKLSDVSTAYALKIGNNVSGSNGFLGWIDDFKVFSEAINSEVACNHANGTLIGIDLSGGAGSQYSVRNDNGSLDSSSPTWGIIAGYYSSDYHDLITLQLLNSGKKFYPEYVCYHDYTGDHKADLGNIPLNADSESSSIRQAMLMPEGPLYSDKSRPDFLDETNMPGTYATQSPGPSANQFCTGCHVPTTGDDHDPNPLSMSALYFDVVGDRVYSKSDDRRQPMQPPQVIYGTDMDGTTDCSSGCYIDETVLSISSDDDDADGVDNDAEVILNQFQIKNSDPEHMDSDGDTYDDASDCAPLDSLEYTGC